MGSWTYLVFQFQELIMYVGEYDILNGFIANLINLDKCQSNKPYFSFISLRMVFFFTFKKKKPLVMLARSNLGSFTCRIITFFMTALQFSISKNVFDGWILGFERDQEHNLKHPSLVDLVSTKQNKLPSFIDWYSVSGIGERFTEQNHLHFLYQLQTS